MVFCKFKNEKVRFGFQEGNCSNNMKKQELRMIYGRVVKVRLRFDKGLNQKL